MKRILAVLVFVLFAAVPVVAQTGAVQSHCFKGGTKAVTSGLSSTNYLDGIIPSCSITVYLTGTTTKATIYADGISTPLANPFTAHTAASVDPGGWIFWAATNAGLDVVMSGGIAPNTYAQPVTLTDVFPSQSFTPVSGVTSIIPGTNVTCSPDVAGSCVGAVTVNASIAAAGVTSLNTLTNDVTIVGDSSITVTPSGQNINLHATGAGGSGVQYNPAGTQVVFTGSSINGDDQRILGTEYTIGTWSCDGTTCTVNTTTPHGATTGDYFTMGNASGWWVAASPFGNWTSGIDIFQVTVTSTTQFTFPYSLNTGSGSGGYTESANYFLPFLTASKPFYKGHSTVTVRTPVGSTMAGLDANFATVIGNATTTPAFLAISGGWVDDIANCNSAATIEGHLQSIFAQAHTAGYTVMVDIIGPIQWNTSTIACPTAYNIWFAVDKWIRGQGKSNSNAASGQYWDIPVGVGDAIRDEGNTNIVYSGGLGTYTGGGNALAANIWNEAMASQSSSIKTPPYYIVPAPFASGGVYGHAYGIGFVPTVDSAQAWGFWNAAVTKNYFNISTTANTVALPQQAAISGTNCLQVDTTGVITKTGSACSTSGLSGMTAGQVPIAATATTVTSSKAIAGTGTGIVTGPTTSALDDIVTYADTAGTVKDSGVAVTNVVTSVTPTSPIVASITGHALSVSCPTCGTGTGGTSVSQNSGAAETNLPITGFMPQVCSDASGSGTAQSCTVANTFVPQAWNCVVYQTTTTNSGTGLTINVNSLGAKPVAIPGASGFTTTLTAAIIPANKPQLMCYDGTNWNDQQTGTASAGGSTGSLVNITGSSQVTATGCTQSASTGGVCTVSGTATASVTFSVIPGTFNNLKLYVTTKSTASAAAVNAQFNSDTAANYSFHIIQVANASLTGSGFNASQTAIKIMSAPSSTGLVGTSILNIPNYSNTTFPKSTIASGSDIESISSGTNNISAVYYGTWNSTAAITSVTIIASGANFANGTILTLYGEN